LPTKKFWQEAYYINDELLMMNGRCLAINLIFLTRYLFFLTIVY
jgi:hypothetical protein